MKKNILIFLLIFSYTLVQSQRYEFKAPPLLFSLDLKEFRSVLSSKYSYSKLTDNEIVEIVKIIDKRRDEYLTLRYKVRNSNLDENGKLLIGTNGKPVKADPELISARDAISQEVVDSIYEFLGEKRYRQFEKTLFNEYAMRSNSVMEKALKKKK